MAIIKCPECGKDVSDKAPKCIHCGYPLNSENIETNKSTRTSKKVKISKKLLFGVCATTIIIVICIVFYVTNLSPSARYSKAEAAFANGKYKVAMKLYKKAGDYEDATIKLQTATTLYNYTAGKNAIENENWLEGKDYLEQCLSYEDSSELIKQCEYGIASQQLEDGNYENAKNQFLELDDYEDSKQKICECNYNLAIALENEGELLRAAELYGEAQSYNDSAEKIANIGEKYIAAENYKDALTVYKNLNSKDLGACKAAKYAEGKIKLGEKDLPGAVSAFKGAGDYLDSKELFNSTTYDYGQALLAKKEYASAKAQFTNISGYNDANSLSSACELMIAKNDILEGNLNAAKTALEKMDQSFSYDGVSASDLLGLLENNKQWVELCGKWISTGGQMRSTQSGSYRDNWWYRDFEEGDLSIEVRCAINDDGKVTVKVKGSVPIYTSYSVISAGVKESNQSINCEQEISSMGTITIDNMTSVTLSTSKISVNYKKVDSSKDVYFTYIYKTDVTFGKKTASY